MNFLYRFFLQLFGFFLVIFFFIGVSYSIGFHFPSEIESGTFQGDYEFSDGLSINTESSNSRDGIKVDGDILIKGGLLNLSGHSIGVNSSKFFLSDLEIIDGQLNNFDGDINSNGVWSYVYDVNVDNRERIPLYGPDGERIEEFGGIVTISDSHRDAASSMYHVGYSGRDDISNDNYAVIEELQYLNADGRSQVKYELDVGSDGHLYFQALGSSVSHTSWYESSSREVKISFYGTIH